MSLCEVDDSVTSEEITDCGIICQCYISTLSAHYFCQCHVFKGSSVCTKLGISHVGQMTAGMLTFRIET